MDKQIQKLCDESLAEAARDHPCFHEWLPEHMFRNEAYICRCCGFKISETAYGILLEKEKSNG